MPVAALLLVASWGSIDEPRDTIRPWIDAPIEAALACEVRVLPRAAHINGEVEPVILEEVRTLLAV